MSSYRDDLEAARLRVDTLEAKVREREASLAAREAELHERDAELVRLRAQLGHDEPGHEYPPVSSPWRALALGAALLSATLGSFHLYVSDPCVYSGEDATAGSDFDDAALAGAEPAPVQIEMDEPGSAYEVRRVPAPDTEEAIRNCYQAELLMRPGLRGELWATLDVDVGGAVDEVTLSASPARSEALDACLARALRSARFTTWGVPARVTVPVVLGPDD